MGRPIKVMFFGRHVEKVLNFPGTLSESTWAFCNELLRYLIKFGCYVLMGAGKCERGGESE